MQFLYPQFLFALLALAIPIIIHLFNFRRYKKIFFTNVKFLSDVQQEHKSRNRLRHLILLLLRLLALACIVIAFAHPFIPKNNAALNPGRKYVSVYIDNSFSMNNLSAEGELLERARRQAEEIALRYKEGDAFQLITNDFELRQQRWVNRNEFVELVNEVQVSPAFRKLSEVYARIKALFRKAENNNRYVYLLSDFQENMADFGEMEGDSAIQFTILPLQANRQNNIYIDSAWFESPMLQLNQADTLYAKVVNASEEDVQEGTLVYRVNGKQKGIANYTIPAGNSKVVSVVYTITDPGLNAGELSLDDYPIKFDNTFYLNYTVASKVNILVVNGREPNPRLLKAFGAEPSFAVTSVTAGSIDYSSLNRYDLIILNELPVLSSGLATALSDHLQKEGNVLVVPPAGQFDQQAYNAGLGVLAPLAYGGVKENTISFQSPDYNNPFFADIFEETPRNVAMPVSKNYFSLSGFASGRANSIFSLSNGDPYLLMVPQEGGYLFVAASAFREEATTFPDHSLFLPSLYKMALMRKQKQQLYYTIGKDNYLQVPGYITSKENIYRLQKDSLEFIPPQKLQNGALNLFVEGLIEEAGPYKLQSKDAGSADTGRQVVYSFNYNRNESQMKFLAPAQIQEQASALEPVMLDGTAPSVAVQLGAIQEGSKLWKWFIILALSFILAETLLIRFWK